MPQLKFTQAWIDRLSPPAAGRVEFWDSLLPGFGVRVPAQRPGRDPLKTWQVMYRVAGRLVREKLGTTASVPKLQNARDLARASIQKARKGVNPVEERQAEQEADKRRVEREDRRRRDTLSAAIDRYLDRYARQRMRADYFEETRRTLERDVKPALGDRPIREITRRDVRELLDGIVDRGSPSQANHALAYLRAMFNWAIGNDLIEANPTDKLRMPSPLVERDRALGDDEIRLFWRSCDSIGWPFGPLFQLLLLTAQRRDELAGAIRSEFDLAEGVWTLPRERVKNDKGHVVHLSGLALEILGRLPEIGDRGLLFTTNGDRPVSGFGRARERLAAVMLEMRRTELIAAGDALEAKKATIEPFTLHDLRRSAATGMAGLGIAHHVLDRVLNHTAGVIRGVARVYNRHAYNDERKAALGAWSRHVESLVRTVPSNIVPIAAAAR